MSGFLLLNGNVIMDAGASYPDGGWTSNHVVLPDMVVNPNTLIGKYFNPKAKRVYDTYDPRSGKYSESIAVTQEDIHSIDIENAKNVVEIKACKFIINQVINPIIESGQVITGVLIRNNLTNLVEQLNKYLGESNWTLSGE